jgi:hypothetical protein
MEGGGLTPKSALGGYSSPAQAAARPPRSGATHHDRGTPTVAPEERDPFPVTTTPMAPTAFGTYIYDENKGIWGPSGTVTPIGIIGDGKPASSNLLGSQTPAPTTPAPAPIPSPTPAPSPASSQIAPGTWMFDSTLGIWGPAGAVTPLGIIGASGNSAPAAPAAAPAAPTANPTPPARRAARAVTST